MAELCLMASNCYLPLLGLVIYPEQSISKVSKDYQHILPYYRSNQNLTKSDSFNLSLHQKVDWKPTNGVLQSNQLVKNLTDKRPVLFDVQDTAPNTILFSFGIAECIRREKIMKLLASASTEIGSSLLELSALVDLWGLQPPITDLPQQTFAPYSKWCFSDDELLQSLIYPTREFYFKKSQVDSAGDLVQGGKLSLDGTEIEFKDILSVIDELHLLKNSSKSIKQTMLVPYFERRRRGASTNANRANLKTVKMAPVKSPEKVKDRTLQKKKKTSKKSSKERDLYPNGYLHSCESLLSLMVDRKQPGQSALLSLKKSGPELPQLLTQISASIAGTGVAVLFSVVCKVSRGRVPFCASKVLTTGVGLGLVWLSCAVNKLRDTVTSISKNSGKLGTKEEEITDNLDRTLKDVYFKAAVVFAVAMLKLA